MTYKRGDVVLVRFPEANLKRYKKRPALVVQADSLITGLAEQVMVQVTSTHRTGPSRVHVPVASPEGIAMGILTDSTVATEVVFTVEDREVDKSIGRCPPATMAFVDKALRDTLNLPGGFRPADRLASVLARLSRAFHR
jgi:mRNA interferase MazF